MICRPLIMTQTLIPITTELVALVQGIAHQPNCDRQVQISMGAQLPV